MEYQIVTPNPYFQISMGCSNREFYKVKSRLWNCGESIDKNQDIRQGFISEKCDYEGDLEKIIISNCNETKEYIELIKSEFNINASIPEGMNIVFTL